MKRIMMALFVLFASLFSVSAFADAASIAVVDLQKIMQTTPKMQVIQQKLEKDFSPRREKLVKMEEVLKNDMEKLNRDAAVLSNTEKKDLQKKIMESRQKFEQDGQAYQQELNTAHNKAMQSLYDEVSKIIAAIAVKQKYDLVLQKDAAPYSASKLDITAQVLEQLK
ncbi:MAG: OmpH family outer membrane protein [Legionellaceae bacterium]|nr:OmpH family outer membrane protein [Legionellaceae bacterium]